MSDNVQDTTLQSVKYSYRCQENRYMLNGMHEDAVNRHLLARKNFYVRDNSQF